MELSNKIVYLIHDEDSYEIVVTPTNGLEIWRYKNNRTSKPEFCRLEWLDEILQDRIADKLARVNGDG